MKKCGYLMLLYGKPYLKAAIESLYPQVDQIYIFYTATPSQGFSASIPCPDSKADLLAEIGPMMDKIEWVEGNWSNEGDHHDAIFQHANDADWLVRIDSDEILTPGTVDYWISVANNKPARDYRVPFLHFWRSFSKVCRDGQAPIRLINPHQSGGFAYLDDGFLVDESEKYRVYHMGYALPTEYIDYKMQVQAHHNEWRADWYESKWKTNAQKDIHPVIFDFWSTEEYDTDKMPDVLKSHPYFGKEII